MQSQKNQYTGLFSSVQNLSTEEQKRLSQPLVKQNGLSQEDEAFLNLVVSKVENGEINLLSPSTLINQTVYATLNEQQQGKVDFDSVNLASNLRDIYGLWKMTHVATYQIENMVRTVRLTKERFEGISGDVYVI